MIFYTKTHHDHCLASQQLSGRDGRKTTTWVGTWGRRYGHHMITHIRGCSCWMSCDIGKKLTYAHVLYRQTFSTSICPSMHTETHKKHMMMVRDVERHTHTIPSCSRTQPTPLRFTQTDLNSTNPSIATSVITQSINSGPRSIWQASTWGERQ